MNRREFVRDMCYGGLATFAAPRVSFAQVAQNGRLVFVLLRGGFDGLAAVVPYGDPDYAALRGVFAFNETELAPLDDTFGLAPGLSPLRALWDSNELAVVHDLKVGRRPNVEPWNGHRFDSLLCTRPCSGNARVYGFGSAVSPAAAAASGRGPIARRRER